MSHTKRSREFQDRIDLLVEGLSNLEKSVVDKIPVAGLIDVLRHYTTDSGCLINAADNEPIFVLRANDELASIHVRNWAGDFLASKANKPQSPEAMGRIVQKHHDAIECADEMAAYKIR